MEVNIRVLKEKHYCHNCEEEVSIKLNDKLQKNNIKGVILDTLVCVPTCSDCGSEVYIAEINDENLERINKNYRYATGRIMISEIEQILEMYRIGAKPLSILLGWGECTIPRYLKGQMPNIENSNKLKAILKDKRAFLELYSANKDKLTNVAQKRIESAMSNHMETNLNEANLIAERSLIDFYSCKPNIYNGMTIFNLTKLINCILFFINKYSDIYITKMNKLLWYADMLCYKRNSFSITGLQYQRINYGPVPVRYNWIYGSLSDIYFNLEGTEYGTKIQPLKDFSDSCLLSQEMQALSDVGEKFKYWYAGELSDYSHKERAYIQTSNKNLIPFSLAIFLSLE
jgi:hypothetical protein